MIHRESVDVKEGKIFSVVFCNNSNGAHVDTRIRFCVFKCKENNVDALLANIKFSIIKREKLLSSVLLLLRLSNHHPSRLPALYNFTYLYLFFFFLSSFQPHDVDEQTNKCPVAVINPHRDIQKMTGSKQLKECLGSSGLSCHFPGSSCPFCKNSLDILESFLSL